MCERVVTRRPSIVTGTSRGIPRYRHVHSFEKLRTEPADCERIQDIHSRYYLTFLEGEETRLKGAQHLTAMQEIEAEVENVRAAWARAVAQDHLEQIERVLAGLFHDARSWYDQGRELFQQAAATLSARQPSPTQRQVVLVQMRVKQARLQTRLFNETRRPGLLEETHSVLERCLDLLQSFDLPDAAGEALCGLWVISLQTGEYQHGLTLCQRAINYFERAGNPWEMSHVYYYRGFTAYHLGRYEEAMHDYAQALSLAVERGDPRLIGDILNVFGEAHRALGEYAEATKMAQAALEARTAAGNRRGVAFSLYLLGDLAWRMGRFEDAWRYSIQSHDLFVEAGLKRPLERALVNLGNIACSLGDLVTARGYFLAVYL